MPITLTKQSASQNAIVGDIVTYTITASNFDPIPLTDVTINDLLVPQLEFVSGSVMIDTIPAPTANILLGVNLGTLVTGETRDIGFKAQILSAGDGTIPNTANAEYFFTTLDNPNPQLGTAQSNTFEIEVFDANLSIAKSANVSNTNLNDFIVYTVTIVNIGDLDALNVIFYDSLPNVATIVNGSFTIDGVVVNSVDLNQGVNIGDIFVGETAVIMYTVQVLGSTCSGDIVNHATAAFTYVLRDGTSQTKQVSTGASTSVSISPSSFKQVILDEYLKIPFAKPDIENINSIRGEVEVIDTHIIKTQVATSSEGQQLSGYKLIVHGVLKEIIEYTACKSDQAVHSAHYNIPFSTFIVLPTNLTAISKLDVEGIVESISTTIINPRNFYNNATILLVAKILYC